MKNKIIGICICMLLIATAVPAVTSVNNSVINATAPSHPLASMTGDWTETQKLLASDGAANDLFGGCLVFSGDTALITSAQDNDNGHYSGSAYVYIRTGTTLTQQAKLLPSDGAAEDQFGYCASIDGDTALIGALLDDDNGVDSGSAYIFTRTGTTWTQQAKLLASDGQAGDRFGGSIAVSGDTALIGAYYDDDNGVDSGSMYVFTRSGTTWTEQQKFHPSDGAAGDMFGGIVSLSGDSALIGAGGDDNYTGAAYVFTRNGTIWTQQAKLLASDGAVNDQFGIWGLSLDSDTALIGAYYDDDMGSNSGSAYIFTRTGTTWAQEQKLLASDGAVNDNFGGWVALSGDTALIGAWQNDDMGSNSGSAYVFTKVGLTFSITGGLGVNLKITNNGTTNVSGVPWQIHVQGGILGRINKTVNGTIDIPAGGTTTVGTSMFLGLGSISITAKVADEEKTATGKILLFFVLGIKEG